LKRFNEMYDPENSPEIKILSPSNNQNIEGEKLIVEVSASSPRGVKNLYYFVNGGLWHTGDGNSLVIEKNSILA